MNGGIIKVLGQMAGNRGRLPAIIVLEGKVTDAHRGYVTVGLWLKSHGL